MEHGNQFDAQNVLGTRWLVFFWLALEEDESRTLFWTYRMILDLFFRAVEPRMQPSRKPTSPWSFYYFFFMVDCQMLRLYFLLFTVTYKSQIIDPQGDAFQTKTEVSYCIAVCF